MKHLNLGKGISFPAEDFIESKAAIIGKSSMGKSGAVNVLLEELCKTKQSFICLDPSGTHYGIRSSFDGSSPKYAVLVIGGEHGDFPIDRKRGKEVAAALVEKDISCVIDTSGVTITAAREFCADFFDELFRINKSSRLIVLEEAKDFIPQVVHGAIAEQYGAAARVVVKGRNKGIGVVMVGQRTAGINKEALSQVDTLIMFGAIAPGDKDALKDWVRENTTKKEFDAFCKSLALLQEREAFAWSPSKFKMKTQFTTKDFTTFHGDRTHMRKHGLLDVKPVMADVSGSMEKLDGALKRLAEEKRDLAELPVLRRKIAELERRLATPPPSPRGPAHAKPDREGLVEAARQAVENERRSASRHHKRVREHVERTLVALTGAQERATGALTEAIAMIREEEEAVPKHAPPPAKPPVERVARPVLVPPRRAEPSPPVDGEFVLQPAHLRILGALAGLHRMGFKQPTKKQVALWVKLSPTSSGFHNYLGGLRSAGLIDYPAPGALLLTEAGTTSAGDPGTPPTVDEFQEHVFDLVGATRAKIIKAVIAAYPDPVAKPDLAEKVGLSPTSSGYHNYLGSLRTLGLIEYQQGGVVARPVLFLEEDA